jgi:hypothetical protein
LRVLREKKGEQTMFEVGKTYKTRDGQKRKVVATTSDGRLIVEITETNLGYRRSDGTCRENKHWDLISDEATSEERELFAQIMESLGFQSSAHLMRSNATPTGYFSLGGLTKFVEILRSNTK